MLHRLEVGYMAFLDPVTGQGNGTIVIGYMSGLQPWPHIGTILESF